jgi:phi13 family phage major tail protein
MGIGVKVGLENAFYSKLISDIKGAAVYAVPVSLPNVQQIQVNPKVSSAMVNSDNKSEEVTQCVGSDITVQRVMFDPQEESELLGRTVDSNGGVYGGETDDPPYLAFGYQRTLHNGYSLYVWILKTKFKPSNSTADTKPIDALNPQFDTMSASSVIRDADGQWIYSIQNNTANYADTFFTQATLQALASGIVPDAIALSSSVPVDDATGISKTAPLTLTFNNKILSEAVSVIGDNGTIVAVSKAFDATGKILTITPSSALSGTTTYIIAVNGVTDINGQVLAPTAIYFTTIA